MKIEEVSSASLELWVNLGIKLWPDHSYEAIKSEFEGILESDKQTGFMYFQDGGAIGFANASIRSDYVAGSKSSPTGYFEGIYVEPEHRKTRIASKLLETCENWLKMRGCKQIASDAEIDNTTSHSFHSKLGFKEVNRVVTYIKSIDN